MRPRKIIDKYYFHFILLVFGVLLSLILYETYRPFRPSDPKKPEEITQAPETSRDTVQAVPVPTDSITDATEREIAR